MREQRFGRMALQDGIPGEQMHRYRQLQLASRAEAELWEKAAVHASSKPISIL
jgi:hypothetical protein